ncbi:MAG: glutamate-5-semialdehyde dehydrogenase [Clostridia bacterium]|nr:glutamate-5-semialdehyde dehydrogenase [Clostridia bacterium]
MRDTLDIIREAKAASAAVAALTEQEKNAALEAMADSLVACEKEILAANGADLAAAEGVIAPVMMDRLRLTPERIAGMAKGVRDLIPLPDPTGKVLDEYRREDGLLIRRVSVSMGVIGIIYESRPNVTSDAAALTLKSGSACVLRGGKEAFRSAYAIVLALREGLKKVGLPEGVISLVEDTTRASAKVMMEAEGLIDLLIPRGGKGLIRACVEGAKVPCIQTGTGICHVYAHASCDREMALKILYNAKTSRPSVCNACESFLVDAAAARELLPLVYEALVKERLARGEAPVELRADPRAKKILGDLPYVIPAGEEDFDTEFLDYKLAVSVVDTVDDAVKHIQSHSTGHSEAIIARDEAAQRVFVAGVDSAAVYVNASTRFTDGGEFGLGCEMGISTQKLHARGPMGLRELTTYKYVVTGNGHVR